MSITDLQHRAFDRALAEVEWFAQKRNFKAAERQFVAFRKSIEAHLEEEERTQFPALERSSADRYALLPIARAQHRALMVALAKIDVALADGDYTTFCASLEPLDRLLQEHYTTEEKMFAHVALPGAPANDEPPLDPKRKAAS